MSNALRVHPDDNVVVALCDLPAGAEVEGVALRAGVTAGHKVAAREIREGEPVTKYGYPIGIASTTIVAGEHVHSHNLRSALTETLEEKTYSPPVEPRQPGASGLTFDGYRRADGRAATRNEIWIVNLVGCVNHASARIAEMAGRELASSGIDGVHHFPHPFGCSQLGDDLKHTQKILAGLARHPNAAGVLVLGLGCENNQMDVFLKELESVAPDRLRYFNAQDVTDEIDEGLQAVHELAATVALARREPIDVSELIVAMKCGGSDGFSGITANPLVGRVADKLSAAGATVILGEVPEMFGAEDVLLNRATDENVFHETVGMLQQFRDYFHAHGERVDENPSPGNKAGGITTLAEKSLGCVQKGGQVAVKQVVPYGGIATPGLGGLALVNSPGNDGVSSTAMTVAGAGVLLFTTGRGTPMGFPAPTVKISSNSGLAERKPRWIDFNAGPIADGTADLDMLSDALLEHVLDVASGRVLTRNEENRHREIAIWKSGVTL